MQFKYDLEDHPPLLETILYGLQWFAISIPIIIVIGKITGIFHFSAIGEQTIYLQKLTFVMALALLAQIFWGHRMPLIVGPSSVLLIGIIASGGFPVETIYTSVLVGGVLLTIVSATGLLGHLKKLFSPRLVAIVLILIAFTLAPTILNLIDLSSATATPLSRILFTLFLLMSMLIAERFFKGVWKSTLIIWAMIAGSLVWFMLFPETFRMEQISYAAPISGFFKHLTTKPSFNAGVMISFMVCFLALFINDLGSIQSMNELLKPKGMEKRINRGILITGLFNALSGFLAVIGPVNFSLSPGVIATSGCASRTAMLPSALLLLLLSFSPILIGVIASVPSVVIGTIMIYILAAQIAAGLVLAFESIQEFNFQDGLIIGLPLMLGTIIAFLPAEMLHNIPKIIRPVLGNGFVVGILSALAMEHVTHRK